MSAVLAKRSRKTWAVMAVALVIMLNRVGIAACRLLPGNALVANVVVPIVLIVAVPLLFYVSLVRRLRLTPILALPPIAVGIAVSASVADPAFPSLCVPLGFAAPALDLAVGAFEARRAVQAYRSSQASSDNPADWFESAFSELLGGGKGIVSRLASLECSIWWHLLCSWRRGPFV